jgi:RHS repeat-associated protein
VFFNGIRAQVTAATSTSTSLSVLVPPFTTRGKISVQKAFGEAASSDDFVVPPLGVSPSQLETVTRTTVGTPTTLSISTNGNVSIAMFDGTEGQRIFVDIAPNNFSFATMSVRDPYGQVLGSTNFNADGAFIDTMALSENGTYAVVLDQGGGTGTGSVSFTISNVPADLSGTLTPGTPITVDLPNKGQNANYTFSGSTNQQATVNLTNSSISFGFVSLLYPDGTLLASTFFGSGNSTLGPVTIPAAGIYTVRIDPEGKRTGSLTLTLSLSGGGGMPARSTGTRIQQRRIPTPSQAAGFDPGSAEAWVPDATNPSNWMSGRPTSPFQFLPPLRAPRGVTALSGHVLRLDGRPLPGVTIRLGDAATITDGTGRFLLAGIGGGPQELEIDGRTASTSESTYGVFHAAVKVRAGRSTDLGYTMWMPKLDTSHTVRLASPTRRRVVVRSPLLPGLRLVIPKGSVIKDEDGKIVRQISITPVPLDRPPYPLFAQPTMYFTLQPDGAEILPRGGRIIYPNYTALPAGSKHPLAVYEADEGGWEAYGNGRVTNDGRSIVPARRVRLKKLTGHGVPGNAWVAALLDVFGNMFGDPVDASTGLFDYEKTDFVLPGPMPIHLTRFYRQSDVPVSGPNPTNQYMFGKMMSTNYEAYLYNPDFNPVTPQYVQMELIMPGERRVHFTRTPAGSPGDFQNAVFQATGTPGPFFKSTVRYQNGWILTRKDGAVFTFGFAPNLREIRDKFGNRVMVLGPGGSAPNPTSLSFYNPITQIVSYPSGRWLSFSYTNQLVTQVTDDLGRVANYTYDGGSRLLTATDPNQSGQQNAKSTTYAWQSVTGCADQVMSSVTDPRQITFISNTYSTNGTCRVTDQFVPTDTHGVTDNYHFAYTPVGQGNVTQTDITDPNGNVTRTIYDATGYLTSQADALGTPSARTFTYSIDPATHRTTSVTDSFHSRRTDYGYNNFGDVTSYTRLAGTSGAVTTNYTYEPVFQQLQTIQDPMTHTTTFYYDTKGCLDIVTDPMSRQTMFDCNGAGQVTSVTDPLTHTTQFAYSHGDLTTATDPLGRVTTPFTDAGGRVGSVTDPLNYVTAYVYDNLNQLTKVTDAKAKTISFFYDEDGNLTQVKDERNASASNTFFAYNDQNLVSSTTDPLTRQETFIHDNNGNLTLSTDRKSQVTEFRYNPLDRVTFAGFNRTGNPPNFSYASTITYTYDVGARLTSVADNTSGAGTINRTYDDLDRVTNEKQVNASNQGVTYTYNTDSTRATMTVQGATQVTYGYNNAAQLTSVTRGTATVGLSYFTDGRLQTLTLKPAPNPISQTYAYDAAGEVSSITYAHGALSDDLSYTYDPAGRRTAVYGTYGRTGLPAAATGTYDAANRILTWNGASASYDLNGNLSGDGTFTYLYNARNQLTSAKQGSTTLGAFVYDGLGRRVQKTVSSVVSKFVYDGWNTAQEKTSNNKIAFNELNGLSLDQVFSRTPASGTASYLLTDPLGSTVGLADTSGVVQTSYTYEPFGKTTSSGASTTNPFAFTGRENDSTGSLGLYNYRARSYSPTLQRFLTEDPLGLAGGEANLYQYANSRPTCATDRLGAYVTTDGGGGGYAITGRKDGPLLTKPDIKQFDDAVRECERRIGGPLSPEERRRLHDEISGLGLDFWEIVAICEAMFGSKYSWLVLEPPYGIPSPSPVPVPVPVPVPPPWEWILSS